MSRAVPAMASMLLSSTLALPALSCGASQRGSGAGNGGARRLAWARGEAVSAGMQVGLQIALAQADGRGRGEVVCEVAVEMGGGSRSSEGEGGRKVEAGTRIRVRGPLVVYHVPKHPELNIEGFEGEVKEVVTTFKGKPVSATFPYKVQLVTKGDDSRKFFAHLKDDEFDVLE